MTMLFAFHHLMLQSDPIGKRLDHLQDLIEKKSDISLWIPFFSSIMGGLLVWLGQYLERSSKKVREKNASLLEIYAYCERLEAEMRNSYRELAMVKTHVEYWWYCHNTSSDDPALFNYYEKHLQSQAAAREIERRIGDLKASYIGHIRKFQALQKIDADVELMAIANLKNPKARRYDFSMPHEKIRNEIVENDEDELLQKYYDSLQPVAKVNARLQQCVKKVNKT